MRPGPGGRAGRAPAPRRGGPPRGVRVSGGMFYGVGHSTRDLAEFWALLAPPGVRRVVDVRRYPASRRSPQFARDALAAPLEAAAIAYRHEGELGGRRTA